MALTSVERAVEDVASSDAALVRAAARATPKAWGTLAARGVTRFKELAGRPPTDAERRAIWAGLWREAEKARPVG